MKLKSKRESDFEIKIPLEKNQLLKKAQEKINTSLEIKTLWKVMNVNAIDRLNMTDHGPVHFQIVANIGLRLSRLFVKSGGKMSITEDFGLSNDHSELVIFLACLMHDLGMSIERKGHEEFSVVITNTLLREILDFLPLEEKVIVSSEILHAIISHRKGGSPLTIEAGIVRVADALDMTKGRSRIPYTANIINMHSLSHAAVESVKIYEGKKKPIEIRIVLNNSVGIFQIDELLKSKIMGSKLEKYVEVKAYIEKETEKKLISSFDIKS